MNSMIYIGLDVRLVIAMLATFVLCVALLAGFGAGYIIRQKFHKREQAEKEAQA